MRETLAIHSSLSFAEAANGRQALDLAQTIRPDLVLLDVMIPLVDGLSVCRTIKNNPTLKSIYVVLVTALNETKDIINGADAGADDFLPKPFEEDVLLDTVTKALHIDD